MKLIHKLLYSIFIIILLIRSGWFELYAVELDPGGNRVGEGLEHYNQGEYFESLRSYQEAESYFPDDPRLEFNRGAAEFKSGNLDKAIRHFEKSANSSSPEVQWKSRFNLGNSYLRAGDRKRAAEEYIKALKINPDLQEARKNLEYLRKTPPPSGNQSKNSNQSPSQNQPQSKGGSNSGNRTQSEDRLSKREGGGDPHDKRDRLTEEESKRIMDSLDLNKIRRKSRKSRDREVFW
ncbi:tetratricopeptide repeat protein [Leptospira sp. FAT2]|uniref:TPR repeat-containing protein BatC n=1 Tax=Leptospira sanjuanensis TaxID=2879643 RepID=UPI001EE91177|nr:tetratricopeptide repeat protein [Leptospira sanjuanensis]MCG6195149.1 tetratricopeptide repeat protein [Leptospira sanjuanensis]